MAELLHSISEVEDQQPLEDHTYSTQSVQRDTPQEVPVEQSSVLKDVGFLLLKIVAIVAVFALLFTFVFGLFSNSDSSMVPAVKDGDLVIFYRLDKDYALGDLAVLDVEGQRQVRRVVATAGDIVDISEDGLLVNGALQQEPDIYFPTNRYDNKIVFPLTLSEGQVFMLGDSRENATDGRVYGAVEAKDTSGKVMTVMRRRNF